MIQTDLIIIGTRLVFYFGDEESVIIPNEVDIIGDKAFYHNMVIKQVILPQNIVVENKAFEGCENLERLTLHDEDLHISRIGKKSFKNCKNLTTNIIFTGSVIEKQAFSNCRKIESIVLPDSTYIEKAAFFRCTQLKRLCSSGDVWKAGILESSAFEGCEALQTEILIEDQPIVERNTFLECSSLKHVQLPPDVRIKRNAFFGCRKLERICDREDVAVLDKIGPNAFFQCQSLKSIIKVSDNHVPAHAFFCCESIETIELIDNTKIDKFAFSRCQRLKRICHKGHVFIAGRIGYSAFEECTSLVTPIKVTQEQLPSNVFLGCKGIKRIYLPQNIIIDDSAFENINAEKVFYNDALTSRMSKMEAPDQRTNDRSVRPLSIPEDNSEHSIGFKDFLVRTSIFRCRNQGHVIKNITATVYCLTRDGDVIKKKIMAGYCQNCNQYYLLNREYEKLRTHYVLLCKVIDNTEPTTNEYDKGAFAELNKESILKQYGYTVNQEDGLSTIQRRTILEFILVSNILTKTEICSHLDWLINTRAYDTVKFRIAIKKWKEDREYIEHYQVTDGREIFVKSITKGQR